MIIWRQSCVKMDSAENLLQLKKSGKYRTLQGCELNLQALCETYFPHMEFEGNTTDVLSVKYK